MNTTLNTLNASSNKYFNTTAKSLVGHVNSTAVRDPRRCGSYMDDLRQYSDKELYEICKRFGSQALRARNRFIGLLPEVDRRRLFEKKGFFSIFHFAAVTAGVSEELVRKALNLNKRFEGMPALKTLLVTGQASVNKLARVASIATAENEEELAQMVLNLSKSALEVFVKDYINERNNIENKFDDVGACGSGIFAPNPSNSGTENENQNGLFEPRNGVKFVPGHSRVQSSLPSVNNDGQSHSGDGGNKNFTGESVGDKASVGKNHADEPAATKLISYIKDMLN